MIVPGVRAQGLLDVAERRRLVARVQRDSAGINPFVGRLRRRLLRLELALADLQVEPGPLEQLAFVRVALDDIAEGLGGRCEIAALQRLQPALVHRHGLVIGRLSGRWRSRRGRRGRRNRLERPGRSLRLGRPGRRLARLGSGALGCRLRRPGSGPPRRRSPLLGRLGRTGRFTT